MAFTVGCIRVRGETANGSDAARRLPETEMNLRLTPEPETMKTVHTLTVILGLLGASAAFAANPLEQSYLASFKGRTDIPVPVAVVSPRVGPAYAGETVQVAMIVDENGRPGHIRVLNARDAELADHVADAMAQWRFAPAHRDGKAVAVNVEVPVRIVKGTDAVYAMN